MSLRRAATIASIRFGGMSEPVTAPRFICSASWSGICSESAIAFVMSAEPPENTLAETGVSLSKTMMERVSAPMLARHTPAVFCDFESVAKLAAKGEAMTPSTSIPAPSTASMSSS